MSTHLRLNTQSTCVWTRAEPWQDRIYSANNSWDFFLAPRKWTTLYNHCSYTFLCYYFGLNPKYCIQIQQGGWMSVWSTIPFWSWSQAFGNQLLPPGQDCNGLKIPEFNSAHAITDRTNVMWNRGGRAPRQTISPLIWDVLVSQWRSTNPSYISGCHLSVVQIFTNEIYILDIW